MQSGAWRGCKEPGKVDIKSIEYRLKTQIWPTGQDQSRRKKLAEKLENVDDLHDEKLRRRLLDVVEASLKEQRGDAQVDLGDQAGELS